MSKVKKNTRRGTYATTLTLPDGKKVYLTGKTKEELEEKKLQAKIDVRMGVDVADDSHFDQFARTWLAMYKRGKIRQTSFELTESLMERYVVPYFSDRRIKDVRPMTVQGFITYLSDTGLAESTQAKCLRIAKNVFQAAVDNGLIPKTPFRKDDRVVSDTPKEEPEPLTDEQARRLLTALEGTQAYTFCLIALSTGMRRGEILGLMWEDIDFDARMIHVRHNKAFPMNSLDAPVTELLKTEAARRDLPMSSQLTGHLLAVKEASGSDYVLAMKNGKSLSKSGLKSLWTVVNRRTAGKGPTPRKLGESYGGMTVTLDFDVHPHLLRHTFITQLFEAGLDIKQVQYLAGHSTPDMTMRVYNHYRAKQRQDATAEQVRAALKYLDRGVSA